MNALESFLGVPTIDLECPFGDRKLNVLACRSAIPHKYNYTIFQMLISRMVSGGSGDVVDYIEILHATTNNSNSSTMSPFRTETSGLDCLERTSIHTGFFCQTPHALFAQRRTWKFLGTREEPFLPVSLNFRRST